MPGASTSRPCCGLEPEARRSGSSPRRHAAALLLVALLAAISLAAADPAGGRFEGLWQPTLGDPGDASFSYHREQDGAGRITVLLPTGEVFAGEYLRLAGDARPARFERIFARWRAPEFDRFELGPADQPWKRSESTTETFRRKHRDRVVAVLISEGRASMRCSFALKAPLLGLPGGASGRCQVSDGATVEVPLPPARAGQATEFE